MYAINLILGGVVFTALGVCAVGWPRTAWRMTVERWRLSSEPDRLQLLGTRATGVLLLAAVAGGIVLVVAGKLPPPW